MKRAVSITLAIATLLVLAACGDFFIGNDELSGLAISPTNPTIQPTKTQQFTANGTFGDGSTRDISSTATWTSSSPGIATISSTGLATAVAIGSTTITATSGKFNASTTLTVSNVVVNSVTISPLSPQVRLGQTQQFTAIANRSDGTTSDVTTQVTWTSSNNTVATINSAGLATASSTQTGSTTINATLGTVSATQQATLTVSSF